MHWSEKIAREIVARAPEKEMYVCAAGTSPSGSIHIGNFRDIATSLFVCRSLIAIGKKAKLLLSWDDFDRLRKVPVNVQAITQGFEEHIGKPYADCPDPFGCCSSYAEHFEKEYENSLKKFGIELEIRYQTKEYRSGRYSDAIIESLQKRFEICDILAQFRTQGFTEEERQNYYPVSIYCPVCGKDYTKITSLSSDCKVAEYRCSCGHTGTFDFTKDFNCKLAWKIDWPMRWRAEGVDFEPGGKDHASPGGSYQTSKIISEQVFNFPAPIFQGYEFIGIKGATGKMSGSTGLNLTPDTLLNLYQPEVILWLYSKSEPNKAFDFCFDDEILRQYFEFDKMYSAVAQGTADEYASDIIRLAYALDRKLYNVPMAQLVSLGSVVDFNPETLEKLFEKIGTPFKQEEFAERLKLAKYWLEICSPENMNTLKAEKDTEFFASLSNEEQQEIKVLHKYLANEQYTMDELMAYLYDIPRQVFGELTPKELKNKQATFFSNVYKLLIDKTKGPRLYLFLYAIEKDRYLKLLDF